MEVLGKRVLSEASHLIERRRIEDFHAVLKGDLVDNDIESLHCLVLRLNLLPALSSARVAVPQNETPPKRASHELDRIAE